MTFAERAFAYADGVVTGEILAGKYVRLAARRHLQDLRSAKRDDDFEFYFDADAVEEVCGFVELLPHVKGKWMGTRIRLEDWQVFKIACVYGWKQKADGLRRFRKVYEEVPRKNAKSTIIAALGLYALTADGEFGPEVYSGAGSEKQAWEVFGPARLMAKNTPKLCRAFGVEVNARGLARLDANGKFEPVIGDPGDGASPSFSITDEYHEHRTASQYDTMLTGMGSREQPIAWVVTTAGFDTNGPCYDLRRTAIEVLEGKIDDPSLFALIYTIDEDDDWTSVEALKKANPNYGVSVFEEYLRGQQRDAINNARKQVTFRTKHLNVWETAASPFFNGERFRSLADETLSLDDFRGEECWIGLDLASKLDLASVALLFRRYVDDVAHWYAFVRNYLPAARAEDPDFRHYGAWVHDGRLIATPGDITDYAYIEADLAEDLERFDVRAIGADPHNATYLLTRLADLAGDDRVVEIPMTVSYLSEPMKELQALVEAGRLHHDGDPVLEWAIGNVTARADRNENVFPRKERPENKIDPVVALICAMNRAMVVEEVAMPSIYAIG